MSLWGLFKNAVDTVLSAPERLARMWINKTVGPFLEDDLQRENFEWALANGKPVSRASTSADDNSGATVVSISNVRLSAARLNRSLRQTAETAVASSWVASAQKAQCSASSNAEDGDTPRAGSETSAWAELIACGAIEVRSVVLGNLQMSIPWADLASKSTRITVKDAEVTIRLLTGITPLGDATDDRTWTLAQSLLRRLHVRLQNVRDARRQTFQTSGDHMTKSGFDVYSKNYQEDLTASLLASLDWEEGTDVSQSRGVQDSMLISNDSEVAIEESFKEDDAASYVDSLKSTQLEGLLRTLISLLSFTAEHIILNISVCSSDEVDADSGEDRSAREIFAVRLVVDTLDVGSADKSPLRETASAPDERQVFEKSIRVGKSELSLVSESGSEPVLIIVPDCSSSLKTALTATISYSFTSRGDIADVCADIIHMNIAPGNILPTSGEKEVAGNCLLKFSQSKLSILSTQFKLLQEFAAMCRFLRGVHTPMFSAAESPKQDTSVSLLRRLSLRLGSVVIDVVGTSRVVFEDVQLLISKDGENDFQVSCEKFLVSARTASSPFKSVFGIQHSGVGNSASEAAGCSRILFSLNSRSSFRTREQIQTRAILEVPYSLHAPQRRKTGDDASQLRDGVCCVLDHLRWKAVFDGLSLSEDEAVRLARTDRIVVETWRDIAQLADDFRSGHPDRYSLVDSVPIPRFQTQPDRTRGFPANTTAIQNLLSLRIPLLSVSFVLPQPTNSDPEPRYISAIRCEARQVNITNQTVVPGPAGPQGAFDASDESILLVEFETFVVAAEMVRRTQARSSKSLRLLAKVEATENTGDRPRVQLRNTGTLRRSRLTPQVTFDYRSLFSVRDAYAANSAGSSFSPATFPILLQRVTWPHYVQVPDPVVDADFLRVFVEERAETEISCVLPLVSVFLSPDMIFGLVREFVPPLLRLSASAQAAFLPPNPPPVTYSVVLASERTIVRVSPCSDLKAASGIEFRAADLCVFFGSDPHWNSLLRTSADLADSTYSSIEFPTRRTIRSRPVSGEYALLCVSFSDSSLLDDHQRILARSTPVVSSIDERLVCSDAVASFGYVGLITALDPTLDGPAVSSTTLEFSRFSACTNIEAIRACVSTLENFFARELSDDPPSLKFDTQASIVVRDASCKFVSSLASEQNVPHAMAITLSHAHVQLTGGDAFSVGLGEISIWLKQSDHFLRNDEVLINLCAPDLCATEHRSHAQTHFAKKSLVLIAIISEISIASQAREAAAVTPLPGCRDVLISFPSTVSDFNLEIPGEEESGNSVVLCLRADSLRTLLEVTEQLRDELASQLAHMPEPADASTSEPVIIFIPSEELPSSSPRPKMPNAADVLFDETSASPEVFSSIETIFDEFEVMEVPVDSMHMSSAQLAAEHARVFPEMLADSAATKIVLSGDRAFRFVVVFEGGCDWHECQVKDEDRTRHNRAIEGRNDRVALSVTVSKFEFTDAFWPVSVEEPILCPDRHRPYSRGTRIRFDCSNVSILDFVHTSHHRYFLHRQSTNDCGWTLRLLFDSQIRESSAHANTSVNALKIEVAPLRLFIDENTLLFLIDFWSFTPRHAAGGQMQSEQSVEEPVHNYRHLEISQIDLLLDYKPKTSLGEGVSDFFVGNYVYLLRIVELVDTPLVLNRVCLTPLSSSVGRSRRFGEFLTIKDLFEELTVAWLTHLQSAQVLQSYLGGSRVGQPMHVAVRLGSAVANLVRVPVSEYRASGGSKLSLVRGAATGATHLASTVTVEVLNLATSAAVGLSKGISKLDKVSARSSSEQSRPRLAPATNLAGSLDSTGQRQRTADDQHLSRYADQPRTISDGAAQAYEALRDGASGSYVRLSRDGLYGVPGATLSTLNGVFLAVSKLTLAGRNMVDGGAAADAAEDKFKSRRSQ